MIFTKPRPSDLVEGELVEGELVEGELDGNRSFDRGPSRPSGIGERRVSAPPPPEGPGSGRSLRRGGAPTGRGGGFGGELAGTERQGELSGNAPPPPVRGAGALCGLSPPLDQVDLRADASSARLHSLRGTGGPSGSPCGGGPALVRGYGGHAGAYRLGMAQRAERDRVHGAARRAGARHPLGARLRGGPQGPGGVGRAVAHVEHALAR